MPSTGRPDRTGSRPALRLACGLAALLPVAAQGQGAPHPALTSLVPLIQVYDARSASPEFDVAGIRCGALTLAQDDWAQRNPGHRRPDTRAQRAAENNLTAAQITRQNRGVEISRAYVSTRDDVVRVIGLYRARFEQNARDGRHPWQDDPLLVGDARYCDILNR